MKCQCTSRNGFYQHHATFVNVNLRIVSRSMLFWILNSFSELFNIKLTIFRLQTAMTSISFYGCYNYADMCSAILYQLSFGAMSLAWPTVVQLVVSFNSGLQWGLAKSTLSLFRHSDRFDFCVFAEMH